MFVPEKFPCTAWFVSNGVVVNVQLTRLTGRQNQFASAQGSTGKWHLCLMDLFDSPADAIKAEIESTNTECQRLRKLLHDAEDRRHAAILLQADL